jgi:hypothetical protein
MHKKDAAGKVIDSSDEEVEVQKEEKDDGKRDKIFSKTFLRSLSNQCKFKMAFIQQMGENKYDRAQLQTKVLKPSVFNSINNINSPPSKPALTPKYFNNTTTAPSFLKGDEDDIAQITGVNL